MHHTRRDFLKASFGLSGLVSLSPAVPAFLWKTARAEAAKPTQSDTVLVVVQLTGGNDGLNTIIPYADDIYIKRRPTLHFTAKEVHKIGDTQLGFHPRMKGFRRLYDEGLLTVVQGVGYPNSSRDHFSAMRNWQTALPGVGNTSTGWLGRAIDTVYSSDDVETPAVLIGQTDIPMALRARNVVIPGVRSLDDWVFRTTQSGSSDGYSKFLERAAQANELPGGNPLLETVRRNTAAACATNRRIQTVANSARWTDGTAYPEFGLAQRLRTIAQLIRADVGIRVFFAEPGSGGFGGFDNHANQRGNHCAMLEHVSESVAAFLDDLKRDGLVDRVLLMTFSEFGRTVSENGRRGTGHGAAGPMFFAGGRVKGGLTGRRPSLTDLDNDALKFHTDFRQVYATVLDSWLGYDSESVLQSRFQRIELFSA